MAYTSLVTSWYLQWLFIYCHILCTAQRPKGTSGSRMRGKAEQLQTFTGGKLNSPAICVHSLWYERAQCKKKVCWRNAVFTGNTFFSSCAKALWLEDETLLLSEDRLPEPRSDWALCLSLDFARTTTLHESQIIWRKQRHKWGVCSETVST